MGVTVSFDYGSLITAYPQLGEISEEQAAAMFAQATVFHRNDGGGPVEDTTVQLALLNMVTAHLIYLRLAVGDSDAPNATVVGRISSATQGPVSLSFDVGASQSAQAAWWMQTKPGFDYWQATAPYRTMRWRPARRRRFNPIPGYGFPIV